MPKQCQPFCWHWKRFENRATRFFQIFNQIQSDSDVLSHRFITVMCCRSSWCFITVNHNCLTKFRLDRCINVRSRWTGLTSQVYQFNSIYLYKIVPENLYNSIVNHWLLWKTGVLDSHLGFEYETAFRHHCIRYVSNVVFPDTTFSQVLCGHSSKLYWILRDIST